MATNVKQSVIKYFEKMLKKLRFPRPLQHKFEIKKEVLNSGDAEKTKRKEKHDEEASIDKATIDEGGPKTGETDEFLHKKASPLQDDCFERIKLTSKAPKVLVHIKEKLFLLMCDKPLVRKEVCLNILKMCVPQKPLCVTLSLGTIAVVS